MTKQMKFAQYEENILGLPSITLRFIIADATEALAAHPEGENASYYTDEIMVCRQELFRRLKPNKTNREQPFHATLTEIYVILKNAGYCSNYLLDDLRDLVNDARRPATEQDEHEPGESEINFAEHEKKVLCNMIVDLRELTRIDFHTKYRELAQRILSWAQHTEMASLWAYGDVALIKEGWDRAGTVLGVIGPAVFCNQWWVPVIDPDEEDPTWHKEAGLTNEGK